MSEALVLWDAQSGRQLVHVRVARESHSVFRALAFAPDDTALALGSSRGVTLVPLRR
jgi:hypothetical protein